MTHMAKPIALSVGEPAGIGPDIVIELAQSTRQQPWFAIAAPNLLEARAQQLGLPLTLHVINNPTTPVTLKAQQLSIFPIPLAQTVIPGTVNVANSAYVLEGIRAATEFCLRGLCSGMVSAPVHKGIINDAGIHFTGHTEWLADYCGVDDVVMMLACGAYRIALATTHVPLQQVAGLIDTTRLKRKLMILQQGLQQHFHISQPHIGVCGLNPHAGENGYLGQEEQQIITPALITLRQQGLQLTGPLPADTLLVPQFATQYDAVLAMYHDQGLGPMKACYFDQAVNITLGLPFLRTSVDHGTALELAGTGKASSTSLAAAIAMQSTA